MLGTNTLAYFAPASVTKEKWLGVLTKWAMGAEKAVGAEGAVGALGALGVLGALWGLRGLRGLRGFRDRIHNTLFSL